MNSDFLFSLYDRASDVPDAVPLLRRSVVKLAIRGRLVAQDPEDEPASELLKRLAETKGESATAYGSSRPSPKDLEDVDLLDTPFELPAAWEWVCFGHIVDFSAGRTPPRKDDSFWNTGDFPWVSIADMDDGRTVRSTKETVSPEARFNVFKREPEAPGTMLMSFKLTIGKIARLGIPAFHNEAIIAIRPHLDELDPFLFKVLPELARSAVATNALKGATLNRKSLSAIMVPLPPLREQRRIVDKIEQLMNLCDRIEDARTTRERTRDRLTRATYAQLGASISDDFEFRSNSSLLVDNLGPLTTHVDQIEHLRQAILQLAIRGRLVAQDPEDEPASELLKRLAETKGESATAYGSSRPSPKDLEDVDLLDTPFELPAAWEWVCFGHIVDFSAGRTPPRKDDSFWNTGDFPWVSIADMDDGRTVRSTKETVSPEARFNVFKREPEAPGTMLMSFKLTIGKIARLGIPAFHNEAIIAIRPHLDELDPFLFKVLPELARSAVATNALKGATLNRKSLSAIMVPLPPLREQRRIVDKIEQLMNLCDRMEAEITAANSTRSQLFEALLDSALQRARQDATARNRGNP